MLDIGNDLALLILIAMLLVEKGVRFDGENDLGGCWLISSPGKPFLVECPRASSLPEKLKESGWRVAYTGKGRRAHGAVHRCEIKDGRGNIKMVSVAPGFIGTTLWEIER